MIVHKNTFSQIIHNQTESILGQVWYDTSYLMQGQEYRTNVMEWTKSLQMLKPKRVLMDTKDFVFLITAELQEWTSRLVGKVLNEIGVEKIALVKSEDLFVQMAMEDSLQIIQQTSHAQAKAKFFENQADALKWLSNN